MRVGFIQKSTNSSRAPLYTVARIFLISSRLWGTERTWTVFANKQNIMVAGKWRLEHIALDDIDACPFRLCRQSPPCDSASPRQLKQRAAQGRMSSQDGKQERASAATYVEQPFMATKNIGVRQRSRYWSRKRFHPG